MRWSARFESRRFVIEQDEAAGFYLYVFSGETCTHDYLQDTFEHAVDQANQVFGVPANAWTTGGH